MEIKLIEDYDNKQKIARQILEALPNWFGIEEARENYIKESTEQLFFAALDDKQAIGFLCLKETGKDTLELSVMGVLKEYHRHGIGTKLFLSARKFASENGYSFLQVKTVQMGHYEEYDRTNKFYLSLGFKEFEVFPTLWDAWNPCQIYIMSLKWLGNECDTKYLYLHGLGQTPDSWNKVIEKTKVSENSICINLAELVKNKTATYEELYSAFAERCTKENSDIVLCGLSLGGVLALNYAINYPQQVKALVLIATPYKMPKTLLKIQNMLFRFMPKSMFQQTGFGKDDFLSLCGTMAELDFTDSLPSVSCPVLVVCGEKDNANKKASKKLTGYLKNSHFQELPNTGHEANLESPAELSAVLQKFYDSIE